MLGIWRVVGLEITDGAINILEKKEVRFEDSSKPGTTIDKEILSIVYHPITWLFLLTKHLIIYCLPDYQFTDEQQGLQREIC